MTDNTDSKENIDKPLSKEQHVINFAKELDDLEKMISPFREAKADMKKLYKENNWLSKEEMSSVLKAYRMLRQEEDINKVSEYFDLIKDKI